MNQEAEIKHFKLDLEKANASYDVLNEEYEKLSSLKSDQAHQAQNNVKDSYELMKEKYTQKTEENEALNEKLKKVTESRDKLAKQNNESEEYIKNLCIETENIENINKKLTEDSEGFSQRTDAMQTLI